MTILLGLKMSDRYATIYRKKEKAENKTVNFPFKLCLGIISSWFSNAESREVSLNGYLYDFSVQ